jgi:hypothetical protein
MSEVATLVGAVLSPLIGLALLLWLTHLEDTLPHDVDAAQRRPAPPPILAIPVREPAAAALVALPEQRAIPVSAALRRTGPVEEPGAGTAIAV